MSQKKLGTIQLLKDMTQEIGWSVHQASYYSEDHKDWLPEPNRFLLKRKGSYPIVGIKVDSENNAFTYIFIRTSSWDFYGERTDLHDCLSALLAAFLRSDGSVSCSLWDVPHPITGIETELYARYITIDQTYHTFDLLNKAAIDSLRYLLLAGLWGFEQFFWSCSDLAFDRENKIEQFFSYEDSDSWAKEVANIITEPFDSKIQSNIRRSPTWLYYRSIRSGLSVIHSPSLAKFISVIAHDASWKIVDGMNGRLFLSSGANNLISFKDIRLARKILCELNKEVICNDVEFIPLENCLVAASGHYFLLMRRDCGKKRFEAERERIRKRHNIETELLFPISRFIWNDQIDDEEFESLIRDLLSREKGVHWVRKISPSNERDGGRDLVAEWETPPILKQSLGENGESPYTHRKVVVQCKASKGTVGKSKVQDIGDTVEHYGAQGYFLAVSSQLSTTLTDHLDKRRSDGKIWIDWWTRYEIEEKLKAHPDIVAKYPNTIKPK